MLQQAHRIHGTGIIIYLHENHKKSTIHVGKYTSPMDSMGLGKSTQLRLMLIFWDRYHFDTKAEGVTKTKPKVATTI